MQTDIILGVVIKSAKVGEKGNRVTILSQSGVRAFTCKMKVPPQIFTIAEFSVVSHTITSVYVINPCFEITKDIKKYYKACEICDEVYKLNPGEGVETASLFLETIEELEKLNE